MQEPRKLIRSKIIHKLKDHEWEELTNVDELNELYDLKVREELEEIVSSKRKDIMEFVDLIQVAFAYARLNGFNSDDLQEAMMEKTAEKGGFKNIVLTNLNPHNPSNRIYLKQEVTQFGFNVVGNSIGKAVAMSRQQVKSTSYGRTIMLMTGDVYSPITHSRLQKIMDTMRDDDKLYVSYGGSYLWIQSLEIIPAQKA